MADRRAWSIEQMGNSLIRSGRLRSEDIRNAANLLDLLPFPILWVESDYSIRWLNRVGRKTYGKPQGTCFRLTHGYTEPCDRLGEPCPKQAATELARPITVEHAHKSNTGSSLFRITGIPVEGAGVLELHAPLGESLTTDSLTGVFNRHFFQLLVQQQLRLLERMEAHYTVVLADLDGLKALNDTYGHATGDKALVAFARAIAASIRSADTFGRWGGDEFCLFLPNTVSREALRLAERMRRAIHGVCLPEASGGIRLTASFGLHSSSSDYDLQSALEQADRALYAAKSSGRDRIEAE